MFEQSLLFPSLNCIALTFPPSSVDLWHFTAMKSCECWCDRPHLLSQSQRSTDSEPYCRCSAAWAAKDKARFCLGFFFVFLAHHPTFLGLSGLAAAVQMCGNWVWNGLFEVELLLCSSVTAILPIFPLLKSAHLRESASGPLLTAIVVWRYRWHRDYFHCPHSVLTCCIVAECANKIFHWLKFRRRSLLANFPWREWNCKLPTSWSSAKTSHFQIFFALCTVLLWC